VVCDGGEYSGPKLGITGEIFHYVIRKLSILLPLRRSPLFIDTPAHSLQSYKPNISKQDTLTRARTYSFGSICIESLFLGFHQMINGLSTFLSSLNIPILPSILEGISWCISKITNINEWTFVYIGLYGYSYTSAERNITTLFKNNGMDVILRKKYAGNILFMSNMTIGLLSGVCGMTFATFGYKLWRRAGMLNPVSNGFM
jgi:hypothetical protein